MPDAAPATSRVLHAILVAVAALAILVPAVLVRNAPPVSPRRALHAAPRRVVPQAELPPVEPVAFEALDPDDARSFNAAVPFVSGPNPAARPFRLPGDDAQRARAVDCMAAAVLYEAGDDPLGQRSVAQVVINRVRHPAFPKTICGVVFQGSERTTGCQFTFTCDGALVRHRWSDAAWARARATATAALTGRVLAAVGYATHYHTDWVVPYWQSSLDKIAAVRTHLFFRWTGWWGTPPAFGRRVSPDEPVVAALAPYSLAHRAFDPLIDPALAVGTTLDPAAAAAPLPAAVAGEDDSFLLTLDAKTLTPDGFAQLAQRTCGDRPYCKVMGWTDARRTPAALPLQPGQIAAMSFSYLRDRAKGFDKALWNCGEFRRADQTQCMKVQVYLPAAPRATEGFRLESLPGAVRAPHIAQPVPELGGVRRRADVPVAKATPAAEAH